ncbi:MAG: response regulator [Candidatus Delongbacteria bacterium]|nr:response regulator [Candidatus Delongbacteria bacterium]MBN2834048.1 response regulator [Candidatus Delongbacteria bacterium]
MKKILIVEDNEKNMYLAKFLLEKAGYIIIEARDGEDAVLKTLENNPDLILMDMQLPKKDGYEASIEIHSFPNHRGTKIIALTAYAMKGDKEKAYASGCFGYIEKPIDPLNFVDQVKNYLDEAL